MGNKILRVIVWLGVVVLQLIMSQVVTFLASLLFPGMESIRQTVPILFAAILAVTFTIGIFLVGWLVIVWHWLKVKSLLPWRLLATFLGASLALVLALIIFPTLEPGNPFFFLSILAGILGFHIPGWFHKT